MIEPCHHLAGRGNRVPSRHVWARDHNNGYFHAPCRIDLGTGAGSAGISCNDPGDMPRAHQVQVPLFGEGSPRDDHFRLRQWQLSVGLIDEAQNIAVLRLCRELLQVLPAYGEKHARRLVRQSGRSTRQIWDRNPVIVRTLCPLGPDKSDQRHTGSNARLHRVPAHRISKGVGGVDDVRDAFVMKVARKPMRTPESACAHRKRLVDRHQGTAGIGIDRVQPRRRRRSRQSVSITRTSQDEDAHHA